MLEVVQALVEYHANVNGKVGFYWGGMVEGEWHDGPAVLEGGEACATLHVRCVLYCELKKEVLKFTCRGCIGLF